MSKKNARELPFESDLAFVRTAANEMKNSRSRIGLYRFLRSVYRVYRSWKKEGNARRNARMLAAEIGATFRADTSPMRILMAATLPNTDPKQMSRWTRALEYAASENVSAGKLVSVFKANKGIVGCATLSARFDPKRETDRNDWGDFC